MMISLCFYSVAHAQPGNPYQLSGKMVLYGDVVHGFMISPNSKHVVYRADQDTDEVLEIYSVPITGGTPVKLNGSLVPGGDTSWFELSPDSSRVVYRYSSD